MNEKITLDKSVVESASLSLNWMVPALIIQHNLSGVPGAYSEELNLAIETKEVLELILKKPD